MIPLQLSSPGLGRAHNLHCHMAVHNRLGFLSPGTPVTPTWGSCNLEHLYDPFLGQIGAVPLLGSLWTAPIVVGPSLGGPLLPPNPDQGSLPCMPVNSGWPFGFHPWQFHSPFSEGPLSSLHEQTPLYFPSLACWRWLTLLSIFRPPAKIKTLILVKTAFPSSIFF